MQLEEIVPIKPNNTFLVIGTVTDILIDSSLVQQDGFLSLENAGSLASLGADAYYKPAPLVRLSHAKPGKKPEDVSRPLPRLSQKSV